MNIGLVLALSTHSVRESTFKEDLRKLPKNLSLRYVFNIVELEGFPPHLLSSTSLKSIKCAEIYSTIFPFSSNIEGPHENDNILTRWCSALSHYYQLSY